MYVYEVRPPKNHRGVDLISDALPFGRLWYNGPDAVTNAIGCAEHRSRAHDALIRVYDDAGNVIETDERGPGIYDSKNVTEMSLLSAFKRLKDKPYAGQA